MTDAEKKETLHKVEKGAFVSKKWLAWFIQQLLMAAMAITALVKQPELGWPLASFMVGLVFMMGISTMWYLGKQAALDTAVRGFAMVGNVAGVAGRVFSKVKKIEAVAGEASTNEDDA